MILEHFRFQVFRWWLFHIINSLKIIHSVCIRLNENAKPFYVRDWSSHRVWSHCEWPGATILDLRRKISSWSLDWVEILDSLGGRLNCLPYDQSLGLRPDSTMLSQEAASQQGPHQSSGPQLQGCLCPEKERAFSVSVLAPQGQALHPPSPHPLPLWLTPQFWKGTISKMLQLRGYSHCYCCFICALCPLLQESFKEETSWFSGLILCLIFY